MSLEKTLSIIKPDAVKRDLTGKIIAMFEEKGLRVVAQKKMIREEDRRMIISGCDASCCPN